MADLLTSLGFAASGMQAQAGRLRTLSENIANADTPGYQRKTVSFQDVAEIDTKLMLAMPGVDEIAAYSIRRDYGRFDREQAP